MEGAVKTIDKWYEGATRAQICISFTVLVCSCCLQADQVLTHFSRPLCYAGNAECSFCFIKTFSLDTEGNKGMHLLLHNSKCLNLAGT